MIIAYILVFRIIYTVRKVLLPLTSNFGWSEIFPSSKAGLAPLNVLYFLLSPEEMNNALKDNLLPCSCFNDELSSQETKRTKTMSRKHVLKNKLGFFS